MPELLPSLAFTGGLVNQSPLVQLQVPHTGDQHHNEGVETGMAVA